MAGWTRVADVNAVAGGDTIKQGVLDNESCVVDLYSDVNYLKKNFAGTTAPTSPAPDEGQLFYDTAKDLMRVYNGSAWVTLTPLVSSSGTAANTAGGITESTLLTYAAPANIIGVGGIYRITVLMYYAGANGTKTIKIKLDSTTIFTFVHTAEQVGAYKLEIFVVGTSSDTLHMFASSFGAPILQASLNISKSMTAAYNVVVTGQAANAIDYIWMLGYWVDIIRQ